MAVTSFPALSTLLLLGYFSFLAIAESDSEASISDSIESGHKVITTGEDGNISIEYEFDSDEPEDRVIFRWGQVLFSVIQQRWAQFVLGWEIV